MNKNLELKLVQAYPAMFQWYGSLPSESCMAFGLECGDGWFPIMWALCGSIESHYKCLSYNGKPEVEPVVLSQVKEKFGTLNVYYRGGDEAVRAMVSMAEAMSCTTCETCGSTSGVMRSRSGWIYTRCNSCIDKDKAMPGWQNLLWVPVVPYPEEKPDKKSEV